MPHSSRFPTLQAARCGALLLATAAAALLSGCAAAVPATAVDFADAAAASHPATAAGPAFLAAVGSDAAYHPLTGLPASASDPVPGKLRPLMVMVNNHAAARPQSGLSQADVLVECLAEGGITRLAAFYEWRDYAGKIGPVRSIRPYYIDLGRMFDAIEIHAGGSPDAYVQLDEQQLDHLDEITNAGRYFWRESFRKMPHNLYTDIDHLRAGIAKLEVRTEAEKRPALAFATAASASSSDSASQVGSADGAAEGQAARHVDVTFLLGSYIVSYDYDRAGGVYRRSVNGQPHTDLNDGSQLSAANVVVLGADHKVLDREGRREVKLTGSGSAVMFRQGKAVPAVWRRHDAAEPFELEAADGAGIALTPGRTHYLVVPNAPSFAGHIKY